MQAYRKDGFLWAKGQGTPKEVNDFLEYAVNGERDMVEEEISGKLNEDDE